MKTRRTPMITKWILILVFALVLLPSAGFAKETENLDKQLIEAAGRGDVVLVKTLLDKGADADPWAVSTSLRSQPRMNAASNGQGFLRGTL